MFWAPERSLLKEMRIFLLVILLILGDVWVLFGFVRVIFGIGAILSPFMWMIIAKGLKTHVGEQSK